jgi:hypothetical protein
LGAWGCLGFVGIATGFWKAKKKPRQTVAGPSMSVRGGKAFLLVAREQYGPRSDCARQKVDEWLTGDGHFPAESTLEADDQFGARRRARPNKGRAREGMAGAPGQINSLGSEFELAGFDL